MSAKTSKNALAPRVRTEREKGKPGVFYLRDRDFDYLPPAAAPAPQVDREDRDSGDILGWRWCRHEIENYMLEPSIVSACLGTDSENVAAALRSAAADIRHYQAARWTIGQARAQLPRGLKLSTYPAEAQRDFRLPDGRSHDEMASWAQEHAATFLGDTNRHLNPKAILSGYAGFEDRFTDDFLCDVENVLLWFSGKDLMASLTLWLQENGFAAPRPFRARVRDWMQANPACVLNALFEWESFVQTLRI